MLGLWGRLFARVSGPGLWRRVRGQNFRNVLIYDSYLAFILNKWAQFQFLNLPCPFWCPFWIFRQGWIWCRRETFTRLFYCGKLACPNNFTWRMPSFAVLLSRGWFRERRPFVRGIFCLSIPFLVQTRPFICISFSWMQPAKTESFQFYQFLLKKPKCSLAHMNCWTPLWWGIESAILLT